VAEPESVDVEVNGRIAEFILWPAGTDYEADASSIADLNIWTCIDALERYSDGIKKAYSKHDEPRCIDLFIKLDEGLFSWEKNIFGIAIHLDEGNTYVAEFTLNTAVGSQKHDLRDAVLPAISGTQFTLALLEPVKGAETPLFEEDGWHQWTCWVSSFPGDAVFRELFTLRNRLSEAAFLPHDSITTPYLALRMIQLGQAQALLGCHESEWLETKSTAYEFKNIHESIWKHELAEDVAQFANTENGGLLLLGFRTKRKAGVDTFDKITPMPMSDTRLQTYRDTLRKRIHPPISGLLIESFPWSSGQIVCIFIPPQKDENQPYLVSGEVIHGRFIRSGITIVRRQGDASIPITAEEIHSTLLAGRAFLRGTSARRQSAPSRATSP
jgi:hypothetical protein